MSSRTLSPEEAGRRAEAMARQRASPAEQLCMETQLAHAGVRPGENTALSPPLEMATTYGRPAEGPYRTGDSIYTRCDNPTRLLLEREVAGLECYGKDTKDGDSASSFAFASGMMAASSIILAHGAPMQVILPKDLYHGVPTVMMDVFQRFGVRTVRADLTDPKNLDSLLLLQQGDDIHTTTTTTTLVWIETPSNPLCHVIDIAAICQHVQSLALTERRVTVVVDSTLAPPTLSQPLVLGADLVMHSATKYLGGHSDVLLGVVTASPWTEQGRALVPMLKGIQMNVGGVASPMDCWLCLRGMRTLAVRVARQSATALTLAQHLVSKGVTVHYPGLELHPHHAIAQKQMKGGYGGILSVEFDTAAMAMAVAGALRTVHRATSLGGTETLIEHRASIEPPGRVTSPEGLLRVSIGLEDVTDLIKDFDGAIDIARQVLAGI